jgi:parallel beta-helix repeat protein
MRWLLALVLLLAACGGGDTPPPNPPPNPLYVSPSGSDTNLGDVDSPLKSIHKAAQIALDDYEIFVAPGRYREEVSTDRTGTPAQRLTLLADVTGEITGSAAGEVIIDVSGIRNANGISLSNSSGTVIDGFTVVGSGDAGIVLKSGSNGVVIRNCLVHDNGGDGLRVQDSAGATLFNNLVYRNGATGIVIAGQRTGSPDAQLINNTVAFNVVRGITIGTTGAASPRALLRNNVVAENSSPDALQLRVITEPRSDLGFDGDYDLVSPPNYDPSSLAGAHDLDVDPDFVDSGADDYHLAAGSPAVNAGDNGIAAALVAALRSRTTTGAGNDVGRLDLGFHFLE